MAAQTVPGSRMQPKIYVDGERRRRRSVDPETALQHQLQEVLEQHEVELIVIADLDGAAVACAAAIVAEDGWSDAAMLLAEFSAGVAREHGSWQSMVTNRGYVVVQRVEVGIRTFVVAAQAKYNLPDRGGIARAVTGAMRILRDGLAVAGEAPMPLLQRGGWGDWERSDRSALRRAWCPRVCVRLALR
ncbi:MAG: hypothetical protein NVS3B10_27910 [Polyangiales bacterium]